MYRVLFGRKISTEDRIIIIIIIIIYVMGRKHLLLTTDSSAYNLGKAEIRERDVQGNSLMNDEILHVEKK
jgi:hypothetical protein